MKIYIATDHRGIECEEKIIGYLKQKNIEIITTKIPHTDTDDYVDFAVEIASNVAKDQTSFGILICGTGIGMSIAANKVKGIRAARCTCVDDAYLTRNDNDANILCLSYKIPEKEIYKIIDTFINTKPSDEERHQRRVNKIIDYENGAYSEL